MNCQFYNCRFPAKKGKRYCMGHDKMMGDEVLPGLEDEKPEEVVVAKTGIAKVGKKTAKVNRELQKRYDLFLSRPENKKCNIQEEGCTWDATVVNHRNGRGENVLNEEDWQAACVNCNGKIEENHSEAAHRGDKLRRHYKENLRGKIKQISDLSTEPNNAA